MSKMSVDEKKLKELVKSAMREVLEERDDMLNEALEAALEDVDLTEAGVPADLIEPEELADVAEELDFLLNELANGSRQYLDTLDKLRQTPPENEDYSDLLGDLHELVIQIEESAQDVHDTMHEVMDMGLDDLESEDDELGRSGLN